MLDGLQSLMTRRVLALRTSRGGIKIEVCDHDFKFAEVHDQGPVRSYYGGPLTERSLGGSDIRYAIREALEGERS